MERDSLNFKAALRAQSTYGLRKLKLKRDSGWTYIGFTFFHKMASNISEQDYDRIHDGYSVLTKSMAFAQNLRLWERFSRFHSWKPDPIRHPLQNREHRQIAESANPFNSYTYTNAPR